jgi:hypothetical protein
VLGRPGVASDAILPTLPLLTPPAEAVEEQPVGLGLRIPARARSVTSYLLRASNETSYPSAAAGPVGSALRGNRAERCRRASLAPRFPDATQAPGPAAGVFHARHSSPTLRSKSVGLDVFGP